MLKRVLLTNRPHEYLDRVLLTNRPYEYLDRVLLHPHDIDIIHMMNETYFTSYMILLGEAQQHAFPSTLCNHSLKRHLYETLCVVA